MNSRLLELQLAQAGKALQKAKGNRYSDSAKQQFQEQLENLFQKLKSSIDSEDLIEVNLPEYRGILDFIFKSLEYLDSSTLNLIPFELIYCLNHAMSDWLKVEDNYTIVTSQVNEINKFSFDKSGAFDSATLESIEKLFDIKFSFLLVEMTIPKPLVRDYLASVVLYHELGHFIDTKYEISKRVSFQIIEKIMYDEFNPDERESLKPFFFLIPTKEDIKQDSSIEKRLESYCAEYFCDLFAAQYIGRGYMEYLKYKTLQPGSHKNSHPSTSRREEVYNAFLNEHYDHPIVSLFLNTVKIVAEQPLKKRFFEIERLDFYRFLPLEIQNTEELHGIFAYGWHIWTERWDSFMHYNQLNENLSSDKVYAVINNLIEKSIGNYIVQQKWQQANILLAQP